MRPTVLHNAKDEKTGGYGIRPYGKATATQQAKLPPPHSAAERGRFSSRPSNWHQIGTEPMTKHRTKLHDPR